MAKHTKHKIYSSQNVALLKRTLNVQYSSEYVFHMHCCTQTNKIDASCDVKNGTVLAICVLQASVWSTHMTVHTSLVLTFKYCVTYNTAQGPEIRLPYVFLNIQEPR
jgi:hypothetical protein